MKALFLILLGFSFLINDLPINEAKLLIAQKKYQAALQVLSSDETIEAHYYRGLCHFHLGNCSAASQSFNTFIQSENKYQSENWKSEARIFLNKCQNKTTNSEITQNQPKKSSKIETLKAEYQKSFTEIINTINQQNRYEDSLKFVDTNGFNIKNTNLKSFTIKANDITNEDNLVNKSVTEGINPPANVTNQSSNQNPSPTPIKPKPEIASNTTKSEINPNTSKDKISEPIKKDTLLSTKKQEKIDVISTSTKHHYKVLFAILDKPDEEFLSLMHIGPVTYEKANGSNYIYYVGHYKDEAKAKLARDQVAAAGFAAARVMEFDKGQLEKEIKKDESEKPVADLINTRNQLNDPKKEVPVPIKKEEVHKVEAIKKDQIQEVVKKDVVSYHILFRVLSNPYEKFDDLKQFGPLYRETYDAKGNSRYLIGNTDDLKEAKSLLIKVKSGGYPSSFIVEYINGKLSKIIEE